MSKQLRRIEEDTYRENDSPEIPPPDIIAYNELRSCADLFRMKTDGVLEIHPEFQREFIWKNPDQTRFIDSLIKQLPIPSMCFSLDYRLQKWQVIDGLQRMSTICRLLSAEKWKLSSIDDVEPSIAGADAREFHDRSSKLFPLLQRIQNMTLPITVLRCDYSKKAHTRYLFMIFHRLNTGGMKLNNQEIRNCIYSGKLNNLLKMMAENDDWMKLNRIKSASGNRFASQELILRLFAFHDDYLSYGGRLARFLNDYMDDHRNPNDVQLATKTKLFERTVAIVYRQLYKGNPPTKQPLSILEAILIGVSFNLDRLEATPERRLDEMLNELLKNPEFSEKKLIEGLSGKARVIGRIQAARKVFSGK